jgi:hypothetical protein
MAGVIVVAATFGSLAITQSASASTLYGVSMNSACQQQYPGQGAISAYWDPYSPYSWFCWRVGGGSATVGSGGWSITIDGTVLGGINVGAWCSRNHPGTYAIITNQNAFGWACWNGV